MHTPPALPKGTAVVITGEPGHRYGVLDSPEGSRFCRPAVTTGATGRYYGPHLDLSDWHLIEVDTENGKGYVPLLLRQFDPVDPEAGQ